MWLSRKRGDSFKVWMKFPGENMNEYEEVEEEY